MEEGNGGINHQGGHAMILSYKDEKGAPKQVRLKTLMPSKPITIGRGEEADIVLNDPMSSRIHAAIRYWDDIFVVRDMGSSNGTLLNGKKIEVAKLVPGDVLKVGNTEFKATAEEASAKDVTIMA
jgi:pSer/pThr/pTyr-binding forkhead associated (FHA) protein